MGEKEPSWDDAISKVMGDLGDYLRTSRLWRRFGESNKPHKYLPHHSFSVHPEGLPELYALLGIGQLLKYKICGYRHEQQVLIFGVLGPTPLIETGASQWWQLGSSAISKVGRNTARGLDPPTSVHFPI